MKHLNGLMICALLLLGGCGGSGQSAEPAVPQVAVIKVTQAPVTLTSVLPGRTSAVETSEVRPQVNGTILKRLFAEGEAVRAGQVLYQIDPAPYQAEVDNARAALTRARASVGSTAALAQRYGTLVKINAISKQDYDNAVASAQQASADVGVQQAALRSAQIDLDRTRIRAPISGRIGRSIYTVGALVSASQPDALATIQRMDPIFVDVPASSTEVLRLREEMISGKLSRDGTASAVVRLKLEDGSAYPIEGRLEFADVTVDQNTGSVVLRARFPNPQGLLLPGMFVRAELIEGTQENAIQVPQQAVSRDERGRPITWVVNQQDKLERRLLSAPRTIGSNWLVLSGLEPGERVVMTGPPVMQPGMPVRTVRWVPATAAAQAQE